MDRNYLAQRYLRKLAESGDKAEYTEYFKDTMENHGVDEITDLKSTEDKKEFFDDVDHGWEAKEEQDAQDGDMLEGGLADESTGEDMDLDQLIAGLRVEYEHTNNPKMALEIAMDHLMEDPEYYTKLAEMEGEPSVPQPTPTALDPSRFKGTGKLPEELVSLPGDQLAYDEQAQGPGPDAPGGSYGYAHDRALAAKRYERSLLK